MSDWPVFCLQVAVFNDPVTAKSAKNDLGGRRFRLAAGFTLMEVTIAMVIIGMFFAGLLGGLTWIVASAEWTREYTRATQLMEEKLDTIRLYSWDQINTPGYIQTNFVATLSTVTDGTTNTASGLAYNGAISIADPGLTEAYSNAVKQITVTVQWSSGGRTHSTQMSTLIAQYGMQSFIY